MRKIIVLYIAIFGLNAYAGNACDTRATLAGSMAVTKYSVREELREKPISGPMGEVWRYLAFLSSNEYKKLGDTSEQIENISRFMAENDISSDWRIELLVYNEFFRALCEAKLSVLDIPAFNAEALRSCFDNDPSGRKDFANCIRAQVSNTGESAYTK